MNKIDDILEQLKGQQPVIDDPDALTDRIMDSLPDQEPANEVELPQRQGNRRPLWQWLSMAASILLIIGIGTTLMRRQDAEPKVEALVAKAEPVTVTANEEPTVPQVEETVSKDVEVKTVKTMKTMKTASKPQPKEPQEPQPVKDEEPDYQTVDDPNLHYASQDLTKDTIPYQDPARVDDFIAKLADYNKVKQGGLKCSTANDSNVVTTVYVFPDKDDINLFSRLLQVACWYDSKAPGYHLNFSQQQFFFELKDMRKQLQYRWIAERINGRILFYSTQAPIGVKESSACYQEYRNELMYQNSINIKNKKI
jgi:hypothetical protein